MTQKRGKFLNQFSKSSNLDPRCDNSWSLALLALLGTWMAISRQVKVSFCVRTCKATKSHEELPDLTDSDLEITTDISNIIQKSRPNGIFHDNSNIQKSGNPITMFLLFLRYEIWYVHLFYMPQCSWKGSEVTNLGGVDQCFLWLHVAKPLLSVYALIYHSVMVS